MISLITILLLCQLDHFEFTTISSPQTAGDSFFITINAYDASGVHYDYNGYSRIYTSLDNPLYPQYCDTLVYFNNGTWQGNVTVSLAAALSLICDDGGGHTGSSNQFQVLPNSPARLLSVLPGQTHSPGLSSGRTGSPNAQTAGVQFDISIYLTDTWFNTVDTVNHIIGYTSTDSFVQQSQIPLANGTATLPFAFRTAGTQQRLYFNDITQPSITPDTSSWITVSPGAYSKLLIILPGETHEPGDTTTTVVNTPGKTGDPTDQYFGSAFTVMVYATDTMWNKTSVSGNQVQLYSDFLFNNPSPEDLSNGEAQFTVYFNEIGRVLLWAEENAIRSNNNYLNILTEIDTTVVPDSFIAYPNPMGIETQNMVFAYSLDQACNVTFAIYDPFGNLVHERKIASGGTGARAGLNRLIWDGDNDEGQRVASGVYYVAIKGWTHTATIFDKKMKVGVVW
ncbi:hypothetical protein KAX97_13180 [candidate division WOR-3 bacterium]|nr:hypothetical protein [candidate division WOR-3 bacterium]